MRERPIIFSAPMVRAIMDGRKTQTRRIVKPQPKLETDAWFSDGGGSGRWVGSGPSEATGGTRQTWGWAPCPYGQDGDALWVRENFRLPLDYEEAGTLPKYVPRDATMRYEATTGLNFPLADFGKLRPAIHLPRQHSRTILTIRDISVERLQDITEADAQAEGADRLGLDEDGRFHANPLGTFYCGFAGIWCHINGRASWEANPFVWVIDWSAPDGR